MANERKNAIPRLQGPTNKGLVWRKNTTDNTQCSWGTIDPSAIRGCIDAVTKAGGAVMFGLTADGGAYSICVLQDQDKIKDYPHGTAECQLTLQSIIEWYVDLKL